MDAEERQRRIAELHRKAEAIRAGREEKADPTLRDALSDLKQQVDAMGGALAAAFRAAEAEDEEAAPKRKLTLIYDSERDAG